MKKFSSGIAVVVMVLSVLLVSSPAFAKTPDQCKSFTPKDSWSWNPRLQWKRTYSFLTFWKTTLSPMKNKDAVVMWEENIRNMQNTRRDYSAAIQTTRNLIAAAQTEGLDAPAKNFNFNPSFPANDQAYFDCLNS